jgi:hypothetical protein
VCWGVALSEWWDNIIGQGKGRAIIYLGWQSHIHRSRFD